MKGISQKTCAHHLYHAMLRENALELSTYDMLVFASEYKKVMKKITSKSGMNNGLCTFELDKAGVGERVEQDSY